MLKDKLLPFSIFCLAISISICAFQISDGIQNKGRFIADGISQGLNSISNTINNKNINNLTEKNHYNLSEASLYLGISEERLMQTMNNEDSKIPYIKVAENFIFSKNALDKWIEESRFKM